MLEEFGNAIAPRRADTVGAGIIITPLAKDETDRAARVIGSCAVLRGYETMAATCS